MEIHLESNLHSSFLELKECVQSLQRCPRDSTKIGPNLFGITKTAQELDCAKYLNNQIFD
jgi:hypothetical protein